MPSKADDTRQVIDTLRAPRTIRERCHHLLALAQADRLRHFACAIDQLEATAVYVEGVIRETYPALDIPFHSRWRHFNVGGIDRLGPWSRRLASYPPDERARCAFDLAITSVLLDAGAGAAWRYHEADTDTVYTRSEGLAIASWHLYLKGGFSSCAARPWQADAEGLQQVSVASLSKAFQVAADNPLAGLDGRVALMQKLGEAVAKQPHYFGHTAPRLGHLYDYLYTQAEDGKLPAAAILAAVLDSLAPIWPDRLTIGGVNMGDVWPHPQAGGEGPSAGLVPLHKLSQWLTYSLIEPLQEAGVQVVGVDDLTGLAEYRNGGLFIDSGVLRCRHREMQDRAHRPDTELMVEWRALTVALLDRVAERLRARLGVSPEAMPLARVLEGGTWRAGRRIAAEQRSGGGPPLQIISDGTVF
ncbi:MAG: uracil phosphoribosyltransferase [Candidatus Entotheonella factor]|uniref:Uracil phosphoribosyltransferase n=1 Tax=Entotheonella factor TaxID=1429438 RepID=W4L979_ENTF1|nr:MAG: uracil phosphoribosyltransferase [Candidatus Entotheonella factor]